MTFAFADSPQVPRAPGGKDVAFRAVALGRAYLLREARVRKERDFLTPAADASRLLEEVASPQNLARALLDVARNQGAPGVDGRSVKEVLEVAPQLLPRLQRELLLGLYRPGDVRRVWIPKPGGGQRGLGIPNVVDRWAQEAVRRVLEPQFEPAFHPSSHGFRAHKGAPTAIAQAKGYLEEGYQVVVDLDLSKFFDRVHHQRLMSRVGQRVKDARVLDLIWRFVKAAVVMPQGERVPTHEGTPQGGPLSPLLSNIVLDELDWELERRGLRFVRYADDVNVYVRSERSGRRVMDSIRRFLEGRMRLKVNEEKSRVAGPEELHFLGFCFKSNSQGRVEVHTSRRTKERLDAKIRDLTPRTWGQSIRRCLGKVNRYLQGWSAYFRLCTEEELVLLERWDAHIRRRIRAILIRQKKRARFLYRHLRARGVDRSAARSTAFNGRAIWQKSHTRGIERAYPNAWFHERMTSLVREWRRLHPVLRLVSGQQTLFAL